MATFIERIDDTRSHLTRESLALVSRTRRAGDGLVKAISTEAGEWQVYVVTRRDALRAEIDRLSAPHGIERAALRLADTALSRAQGSVHARLSHLERELGAAKRAAKASAKTGTKKARPAAKRARSSGSRKLVTDPATAS
jgi:hypothetical protein